MILMERQVRECRRYLSCSSIVRPGHLSLPYSKEAATMQYIPKIEGVFAIYTTTLDTALVPFWNKETEGRTYVSNLASKYPTPVTFPNPYIFLIMKKANKRNSFVDRTVNPSLKKVNNGTSVQKTSHRSISEVSSDSSCMKKSRMKQSSYPVAL